MQPKLLERRKAEVNIDCLKRCPFDEQLFAAGHYKQIEGENVVGAVSVFRVSLEALGEEPAYCKSAPVLHLCWLPVPLPEGYLLVAACRDGHMRILRYDTTRHELQLISELSFQSDVYYLYCDASCCEDDISIVLSTSSETVWHVRLDRSLSVVSSKEFRAHEFSVWACRLSPHHPDIFASGDELGRLNLYDLRLADAKFYTNSKHHEGGVSDILFSSANEHTMLTATFGGALRWFDMRQPNLEVGTYRSEGVMWRIVEDVAPASQLLLCMSSENCYEVVRQDPQPTKLYEIRGHESLTYAADWNRKGIVTASFYDRSLCLWNRPAE